MSKQCLNREQMKHLQELGLDTSKASMCWIVDESNKYKSFITLSSQAADFLDETTSSISAFTLQDILDLLPKEIKDKDDDKFVLRFEYGNLHRIWYIGYYYYDVAFNDKCWLSEKELIDAAYEMLCWCIENGYVKTNKNG